MWGTSDCVVKLVHKTSCATGPDETALGWLPWTHGDCCRSNLTVDVMVENFSGKSDSSRW